MRLNDIGRIALTRFDILDDLPELRLCTGYRVDGAPLPYPPAGEGVWERVEPVYETLPGWRADTTAARAPADLPPAARRYVERVEELLGVTVAMIGVGPAREQLVHADRPVREPASLVS